MNNATYILTLVILFVVFVPACNYGMAWLIIDLAGVDVFGLETWQLAIVLFVLGMVVRQSGGSKE